MTTRLTAVTERDGLDGKCEKAKVLFGMVVREGNYTTGTKACPRKGPGASVLVAFAFLSCESWFFALDATWYNRFLHL